jgi:hypothetical protein
MTPAARALLELLTHGHPHRKVYRARNGSGWYVTYRGGRVDLSAVRELFDGGHIKSVYSNCPHDAYHVGRTIDVDRTIADRKKPGRDAPLVYIDD